MKENVNKQVEVTGATGSNASADSTGAGTGSANTGAANSGQTGSTPTDAGTTANRMLTVTSVCAIADSCTAQEQK